MECRKEKKDFFTICQRPPDQWRGEVFINALAEQMPECNRIEGTKSLGEVDGKSERCFVYCAQHSCDAARTYLTENRTELEQKCGEVVYLSNGALAMDSEDLVNGEVCHRNIIAHNVASTEAKACLTCTGETKSIPASYEDQDMNARYSATQGGIPDWYLRNGIYSPLPTPFMCDEKFKHPPILHAAKAPLLRVDITNTDVADNAIIAYWAAKTNESVLEAHEAYGDFSNSGITRCSEGICDMNINFPGQYRAEGEVHNPHVHFAVWKGHHWDTNVKTIEFLP